MTLSPPQYSMNYPTYLWQLITDKTGTMYQTLAGNVGTGTPWGTRLWRCAPNQKPQLLYFLEGNGGLYVDHMTKRLLFLGTDTRRMPFYFVVEGFVYPTDCPDSDVVNIDESQLASMKLSIATAQSLANTAYATAGNAVASVGDAQQRIATLERQVNTLQSQIAAMQSQVNALLTPSQVSDLVWQKLKDMNFLYRLAFNAWPAKSPDPDIANYVNDLVALIRKAK